MFGESLLVAPVFHASAATYYLPAGRWTCLWSDKVLEGPRWVTERDYPLSSIPVFVKQNSVLLLGPSDIKVPDYEYSRVELEVRQYEVTDDVVVQVPLGKGKAMAGEIKVEAGKLVSGGFTVSSTRIAL
jgi:alpha-glucosidase (family GH31 glycosyl hydrolase)